MTTFDTGRKAEAVAATFLQTQGYRIIAQNWRTRSCEIDIVACKGNIAYCVEVKFRMSDRQGTGLDYITPKKLQQMQYAAGMWAAATRWDGDYRLAAIEVRGDPPEVAAFIDDIY